MTGPRSEPPAPVDATHAAAMSADATTAEATAIDPAVAGAVTPDPAIAGPPAAEPPLDGGDASLLAPADRLAAIKAAPRPKSMRVLLTPAEWAAIKRICAG